MATITIKQDDGTQKVYETNSFALMTDNGSGIVTNTQICGSGIIHLAFAGSANALCDSIMEKLAAELGVNGECHAEH